MLELSYTYYYEYTMTVLFIGMILGGIIMYCVSEGVEYIIAKLTGACTHGRDFTGEDREGS